MPKVKKYHFRGERLRLPEIMERVQCKAPYATIYSRVQRGMNVEMAMTKPIRNYNLGKPSEEWLKMGD